MVTSTPLDLLAVLPIRPTTPRTGGERLNQIVLDGLTRRGWRCDVLTRHDLLSSGDPRAVLERATSNAHRILVDTWLYGDLAGVMEHLPESVIARTATLHQLCYWRTWRRPWTRIRERNRFRRFLRGSRLHIGVSRAVLDHDLGFGVAEDRRHVVYPGCDLHGIRLARRAPAAPPEIVSIANYHPRKGFDLLIEALTMLISTSAPGSPGSRATLRLVGDPAADPTYFDALVARARKLGLEDRVHFDGWLDRAEVAHRLENASAFTLASSGEGFGMVVAEALAAGLPTVVTQFETADELLGGLPPSVSGIVPRTPKAIAGAWARLLSSPNRLSHRELIRARGLALARPWPEVVDRFAALLGQPLRQVA